MLLMVIGQSLRVKKQNRFQLYVLKNICIGITVFSRRALQNFLEKKKTESVLYIGEIY